ncbi:hypothetical protein [Pseudomonas aeruginosa]|uniref:hypothetical protein n=1 Tax=Pseudomonas aeruginosa TaxID=287 RepID=UPI0013CDF818|nr:hypothetical protein [Pseudomonas aeruginosa]
MSSKVESREKRKAVVKRLSTACFEYRKSLKECRNLGVIPESDEFSVAPWHSAPQATALTKLCEVRDEHRAALETYKEVVGRVPQKFKTSKSWQGELLAPDEYHSASFGIFVLLALSLTVYGLLRLHIYINGL